MNGDHSDFVTKTVACAPLSGEYYNADKALVFNMIVSFTTGQPSSDWIKNTLKYSDGRRSMEALRNHFAGKGNVTHNLAETERLHQVTHYKSERAITFDILDSLDIKVSKLLVRRINSDGATLGFGSALNTSTTPMGFNSGATIDDLLEEEY